MKNFQFLTMAFLSFFSTIAFAQNSDEDVIVVSAGKIEQSVGDAVESVQVVSAEEIRKSGAKTLTEAVKGLPGVTVKGASAANPVDSISMQGFDSDYVKVLVDGIAVSGDIGGSTAVFQIPVEDIDHIEVVQGASSALYGSDAMGGVINIITKKAQNEYGGVKIHGSLSEEFSYSIERDLRNYTAASVSAAGENLSGAVSGSFDFAPGVKKKTYDALAEDKIEYFETARKRLAFLRGTAAWQDDWGKIGAFGLFSDALQKSNFSATGFDKGTTMEYDTRRIEGGVNGEWNYDSDLSFSGFSSVKNFRLKTEQDILAGTSSTEKDNDSSFIDWESEARTFWRMSDSNLILFGLNGNLQTISGDSFDGREKQFLASAFLQDTVSIFDGRLQIVSGARADFSPKMNGSDAVFMATPKFSAKFAPAEKTVVRFSYGMGYKTPTLKQKYWEFHHSYAPGEGNFVLYGNPDLKSEKSQSVNLSVEQNVANLFKIDASGYFNYVLDMIDSVVTDANTSPQTRTYENIDKAITYGGGVYISTKLDRFDGKIGYSYTGARQKEGEEWLDMALRVTHRIAADASYLIPEIETKANVSAEWNSRQRLAAGESEYTPDYLMLGAGISKEFDISGKSLEIYFRADNILNNLNFRDGTDGQDQEEYFGLNAGTTFSLGGRFRF